jgi:UDP-N-acetylmuramate dehydrogenase
VNIQHNISLKPYNTFGIDVNAKSFVSVATTEDLVTILKTQLNQSFFLIGGGSNMLLTQDINDLVIHINLRGKQIISEEANHTFIKCNAGENWHDFVLWTINQNLGGLENLSLIPGNVGTSPIQNIGAYGVELKDHFYSCEALNIENLEIETFHNKDCNFSYRNSIFKKEVKGKYVILNVTFKLTSTHHHLKVDYGAIKDQLKHNNITKPTIKEISKAVIAIRESKLPDPKKIGNSGSFFKNPIISTAAFNELVKNFPKAPSYKVSDIEVKVPAGWLIETAGFKGKSFGNYGVHKNQALVLVNYGGATGNDILKLSQLIQETVKRIFDIDIEAEVNVV